MIPRYNTSPNFESNIRSLFYDIEEGPMYHNLDSEVNIYFFGGEPTMEYSAIRELTPYKQRPPGIWRPLAIIKARMSSYPLGAFRPIAKSAACTSNYNTRVASSCADIL